MLRHALSAVALALAALVAAAPALANPYETRLANGMHVIVKEDRRAPSVVHMVWYGIGSMDEPDGVSGIAHMLEHMMFKGTKNLPPGEFTRRVAAAGGRDNAFTGRDYTAYFQQIPPARLEEMMWMEADRMANLVISDKEFLPEREVVTEERRMRTDDNPRALLWEQLMATAYTAHPYRRPIIGWMGDIESYTVDDARRWHEAWYAPNNARVVVVGDVDHREVFALAEKHYGPIAAKPLPERRISREPQQRGTRQVTVEAPAELPFVTLAWHVPTLRDIRADRDVYALEVLASVLDGYDGARLPRRMVREEQIAVAVDASYSGIGRGPSLFTLGATPAPGKTVEEMETALREEIARIARDGVDEAELRRVLTQTLASEVYKRDSLMGQAMEIGFMESAGISWRDEDALLEGIRKVTADEVREVAQRYFGDATMTRAILQPQSLEAAKGRTTPFGATRPQLESKP
ncbi:MAG: insulinase family protein [Zoogloeaceae bacterium]|nr:insulinase family protein [Zoogloeaceae bacterium]